MRYLLSVFLFFQGLFLHAQKQNRQFELHIRKTVLPVVIDGSISDSAWQDADAATDFFMVLPMDTSRANVRTTVKMTYDKENLYILAICHLSTNGQAYRVESLRRDFVFGKNDNFIFFLDPFNDLTNGYTFGANAAGAQWDGTLYEGGKADLNWDNKWISAVQ
ncbi:MAG: hydrolase, partial [Chitinophagaceae bacterium]